MQRRFGLAIQLVAALSLSSCQELGLPEQGFVTRHVGSLADLMRVEPQNDVDGGALDRNRGLAPASGSPNKDKCEWAAGHRAQDADAQGFDEDTQKQVYELTLKDCLAWATRH